MRVATTSSDRTDPTVQPSDNLDADTICRTVEIDLTITGAADAGTITIIDAAPVAVSDACPECSQPRHQARSCRPPPGGPSSRRVPDPSARPGTQVHLHQHLLHQEDLPDLPELHR